MKISYPHNLGLEEALNRVKNFASQLKQEYASDIDEASENWNGNIADFFLKAKGIKINGTVEVLENAVNISAKVPLLLKPFQSEIERLIKSELEKLLK